jgi:hypothetical protein
VATSAEGVVEGLQGSGLQVDITEIVAHEANDPNSVIDLFDADPLPGECGREVDFLAINADAAAGCDEDVAVVEGAGEVRYAAIGLPRGM